MIGKKLRKRLEELHMPQRKLAKLIGATDAEMSRYVWDTYSPSIERLYRISKVLGVPMEYFMED